MTPLLHCVFATALLAAQAADVDFKVVTWYDRADPIATFRYRGYDVRKGEYSRAVESWLKLMAEKHPDYKVVVRDVDLKREPGPTDRRKVGAVIQRELLAAAADAGVIVRFPSSQPTPIRFRPLIAPRPLPTLPPTTFGGGPSLDSSPVPVPYPRPHP